MKTEIFLVDRLQLTSWVATRVLVSNAVEFFRLGFSWRKETSPLPENWDLYKQFKSSLWAKAAAVWFSFVDCCKQRCLLAKFGKRRFEKRFA